MAGRKSKSTGAETGPSEDQTEHSAEAVETPEATPDATDAAVTADTQSQTETPPDAPAPDADADTVSAEPGTEAGSETDATAVSEETASDATPEPSADTPPAEEPPVATTPQMTEPPAQSGGPGFAPLALGGLVAGAIGFGAGYLLDLQPQDDSRIGELAGAIQTQASDIASLAEQTQGIEDSIAGLAPPEVDLSGLETGLADLGARLDGVIGNMAGLEIRLTEVESRPIFSGEAGADEAAISAAIQRLRDDVVAQQQENAGLVADVQAMADEAAARIADAEARAEATAANAAAQATISQLRIAIASGAPFAEPLAEVAEAQGIEVPEALAAVADTGVPTLSQIEAAFPAAARAALPLALRANAGDTAGERLGAFLRSQVGGRALEPQEGDDPDAVLSRAAAAVETGDLAAALDEIALLPAPAQDALAGWRAEAEKRLAALDALDSLSAALGDN